MSSKSEFALVTPSKESEARPLVVLLAWLGARRRHVRAYSRLLERNDVQSLTVIGDPNDTIMGRLDNIHALAKRVIAHLKVSGQRAQTREAFCAKFFGPAPNLQFAPRRLPSSRSACPLHQKARWQVPPSNGAPPERLPSGNRGVRGTIERRPADWPTPPVTWRWLNLNTIRPLSPSPALLQEEFPSRRIVLAPFSNGGCYVYEFMRLELAGESEHARDFAFGEFFRLLLACRRSPASPSTPVPLAPPPRPRALADDPTAINLSGVIFDSAPAAITSVSGAVACGKLYKEGSMASLAAYWLSYAFFALMLGITDRSAAFKDRVETFPAVCPEMYVWSREDTITDPDWVEEVIAKRAALAGADVRSARFHGSEHVLHYKHSPRAFTKVWRDFFEDKLGETLPAEADSSDEGSVSRSASFRKAAEAESADACSVVDVKA